MGIKLGGGNSNIFFKCSPLFREKISQFDLRADFSDGLVQLQAPTSRQEALAEQLGAPEGWTGGWLNLHGFPPRKSMEIPMDSASLEKTTRDPETNSEKAT